ncbi:MAG: hypothetical protein ACE10K_08760, partial [Rhodothermales bacterium]
MSEGRAKTEGREPLAFIRAMEYGAIDPEEGLLMAPAVVVPHQMGNRASSTRSQYSTPLHAS